MKKVVGVLLKYLAGFFPQSMERASLREVKLQLLRETERKGEKRGRERERKRERSWLL